MFRQIFPQHYACLAHWSSKAIVIFPHYFSKWAITRQILEQQWTCCSKIWKKFAGCRNRTQDLSVQIHLCHLRPPSQWPMYQKWKSYHASFSSQAAAETNPGDIHGRNQTKQAKENIKQWNSWDIIFTTAAAAVVAAAIVAAAIVVVAAAVIYQKPRFCRDFRYLELLSRYYGLYILLGCLKACCINHKILLARIILALEST